MPISDSCCSVLHSPSHQQIGLFLFVYQEEELEAMKKRLRQWSKQRLQNEGFALFDLSVRPEGRLYRYLSQYNGGVINDELYFC